MTDGTPPKRTGRPSKLTAETTSQIVLAISGGAYIETAAAYAGIHKDTLYEWMKRGRAAAKLDEADRSEEEERYVTFVREMEKALANAELRDLALIGTAAQTQWQAAAWRLERRFPERWRRRETTEVVSEGSSAMRSLEDVEAELAELDDRQLDARLAVYDDQQRRLLEAGEEAA